MAKKGWNITIDKRIFFGGIVTTVIILVAVFGFGIGFNTAPQVTNKLTIPFEEKFPIQPPETILPPAIQLPPDTKEEDLPNIPININGTVQEKKEDKITSDNSTLTQIVEKITQPETVSLTTLITKTDTMGTKTFVTKTTNITPLSFFVEKQSNIDYSNGFIEISAKALTSKLGTMIDGTGMLDILIDNKSALANPIAFKISGKGCNIGCAVPQVICQDDACNFFIDSSSVFGKFVSGINESPSYTFSFKSNLDKFNQQGTSVLEFVLIDSQFSLESGKVFGSPKLVLFTMDIDRDQNQLIITNESGGLSRIYPKDDVLAYQNFGASYADFYQCRSYGTRPAGTISLYLVESVTGGFSKDILLGTWDLKLGETYTPNCGRYNIPSQSLLRNQEYRLVHDFDAQPKSEFDIKFTTPKSQINLGMGCYWGGILQCSYPSPDSSKILYAPP